MNLHFPEALFLTGLVFYLLVRVIYQQRAAKSAAPVKRSNLRDRMLVQCVVLGQIGLPLLYVFTPWLNGAIYDMPGFAPPWGALLWCAGLWVFWRSHADLGTNWSVSLEVHESHRLVTHGVYRRVRHPMYAAFLLFGLAQALLLGNWVAGPAALVAVCLMCIIRVPNEEAMMCEFFGQDYRDYMRRTGRVLPRLSQGV